MRIRESGMPEEVAWEGLFDVGLILNRMGVDGALGNVAELGCGYGTFTIPVAQRVSGWVITYDLDEGMLKRTRLRAVEAGLRNIACVRRDVIDEGWGVGAGSMDAVLLFNILHCAEPVALLASAAGIVRPGGAVLAIHWRRDAGTPRGPSMEIRPSMDQIGAWGRETGMLRVEGGEIPLAPWHHGVRLIRM